MKKVYDFKEYRYGAVRGLESRREYAYNTDWSLVTGEELTKMDWKCLEFIAHLIRDSLKEELSK